MGDSAQAAARLWALTTTPINVAANGTRALVASPGEGYSIWVYGLMLVGSASGTITLQDGAGTPIAMTGTVPVGANGGFVLPISADIWTPWFRCTEDKALNAVIGAGPDVDGLVVWRKVPAAIL